MAPGSASGFSRTRPARSGTGPRPAAELGADQFEAPHDALAVEVGVAPVEGDDTPTYTIVALALRLADHLQRTALA